MFKKTLGLILNFLYPQSCLICHQAAYWLCPACLLNIEVRSDNISIEGLDMAYIACDYSSQIRSIIWSFKYANQPQAAELLTELLSRRLHSLTLPSPLYLVPIPLSKNKLKFRGYNQAELLAQHLGEKIDKTTFNPLQRVRKIRQQAHLGKNERFKNTANSFLSEKLNSAATYIIIDDVLTTGATMSAAALALRQAGAKNVWGLAVARNDRKKLLK